MGFKISTEPVEWAITVKGGDFRVRFKHVTMSESQEIFRRIGFGADSEEENQPDPLTYADFCREMVLGFDDLEINGKPARFPDDLDRILDEVGVAQAIVLGWAECVSKGSAGNFVSSAAVS